MFNSTAESRFLSFVHVEPTTGCWLWTGGTQGVYGAFHEGGWHGRSLLAHRAAYELFVGPIPEGLHLDHVRARGCSTTLCVNPGHLEPVTPGENVRRGIEPTKTHCLRGHPLSGENLKSTSTGGRRCRACTNMHARSKTAEQRKAIRERYKAKKRTSASGVKEALE